jgi:ABC-type lipoprotein export system ATPase subunit
MEPAVLLADEPTGNLDSEMATQVLLTIKEVQAATGQTVLLATHDVHTAAFADEVVLLRDGRIADRLCLEGWSVPEALAVSEGRFGDDRMRVVLSWLRGEAPEPRRRRPTRR